MIEHGPATEEEMILAFLQAEVPSPRWRTRYYDPCLATLGCDDRIVDHPDLTNLTENAQCNALLTMVRGFANRTGLFNLFPTQVTWRHATLEPAEFGALHYINDPSWATFSDGTRKVSVAAQRIRDQAVNHTHVAAIIAALQQGITYPPLIAASDGSSLVLIEGHTRATAYALTGILPNIIIGSPPTMTQWHFW